MKTFRRDLWEDGEYTYAAAYGFVPNVRAFLHEEDDAARDAMLVERLRAHVHDGYYHVRAA